MNRKSIQGFTLTEIAVSLAAFGLIMAFTFGMMATLSRSATENNQMARAQADARVALDMIEADLRSAGADIDYADGQRHFVYADPYQVVFNANLFPAIDDGTGFPRALNPAAGGAGVPSDASSLYVAPAAYDTGAETVMLTIDSTRDGIVGAADKADDLEEDSANPNDYVLYRGIYGWDGAANTADVRPLAVVRGPEADGNGELPPPLFSYWIDHDDDRSTDAILFGDNDADGELSQAERGALGPVTGANLARIERVRVSVVAESNAPTGDTSNNDGYLRHVLASEVKMRQRPSTTAVVYGRVYLDLDADGVFDQNESAIPDVVVRSSSGRQTKSRGDGSYRLEVQPGQQTIIEEDPTGYLSTTPNSMSVDLYPGDFFELSFGDNVSGGTGTVTGVVFDDLNENGMQDQDEVGLGGVKIYSDGGEYAFTAANGAYALTVPVGNRTISEFNPEGYMSTTPDAVNIILANPGDVMTVNFGDTDATETGTVQGWVYLDDDRDGVRDRNEDGVLGATITIDGQAVDTDGSGFFTMTVTTGNKRVEETDPPGYTSTTPNTLHPVQVDVDEVVTVYFGDIVEEDVDFDVIDLAETERALSIGSGDLVEDGRGDPELLLGTRFAGSATNNLLVWINQRQNQNTPNGSIFSSTPSYTRANLADVTALATGDLDRDGDKDLVTGLSDTSYPLLNIWYTDGGTHANAADLTLATSGGSGVLDLELADMDSDGDLDIVAGLEDSDLLGHVEIWWNDGSGGFSADNRHIQRAGAWSVGSSLGECTSLSVADINHDGWLDLAVGAVDGTSSSSVNVYLRSPYSLSDFLIPHQAFDVQGTINDLQLLDMVEDDQGDIDVLIATEMSSNTGVILQWNRASDGYLGLVNEGSRVMDDSMPTMGAPLRFVTGNVDNDVFPDIIVGTRLDDSNFVGYVQLARTFGHMPSEPTNINDNALGVVVTITKSDFNLDGSLDFAIGTQEPSNRGRVYVFYGQ